MNVLPSVHRLLDCSSDFFPLIAFLFSSFTVYFQFGFVSETKHLPIGF